MDLKIECLDQVLMIPRHFKGVFILLGYLLEVFLTALGWQDIRKLRELLLIPLMKLILASGATSKLTH
jgi:hypothetical protein